MDTLVTGHRGYIGSRFFRPGWMGCDLKEGHDFQDIRQGSFRAVIHLAAWVSVIDSFERPGEYLDNNCFKILRFLRNNRVDRFVLVSTGGAMYGNTRLATEDDAAWGNCMSPYAQSKYLAEEIVRETCPNHIILRLGNVYGGDYSVRGEASVHAHFQQDHPIVVYGGRQTRDFIHVDQVCGALLRSMDEGATGTFNIGSGVETKILDLAGSFSRQRGVPVEIQPARPGEVDYISLDISKAIACKLLDSTGTPVLESECPPDLLPVQEQPF